MLTLADAETPLWLDDPAAAAQDWIAFHCGCTLVPRERAQFAVALDRVALDGLSAGAHEEPERSATLILQVDALGEGAEHRLSGPGLAAPSRLMVRGLPDDFVREWAANCRLFPRGIDVILCAGDRLAALPRTVRIEAG